MENGDWSLYYLSFIPLADISKTKKFLNYKSLVGFDDRLT